VSWASSKQYQELAGAKAGWANVPAGTRASTYSNPDYLKSAGAFADITHQSIADSDPRNPGVQKRPTMGIQFVDIPEFSDLGTKVSQEISAAIAGKESVETALSNSQKLADKVGEEYRNK
jgi:sorbitol/mannitol transport system substrate-binding protein